MCDKSFFVNDCETKITIFLETDLAEVRAAPEEVRDGFCCCQLTRQVEEHQLTQIDHGLLQARSHIHSTFRYPTAARRFKCELTASRRFNSCSQIHMEIQGLYV
jgi:hypothetical protein